MECNSCTVSASWKLKPIATLAVSAQLHVWEFHTAIQKTVTGHICCYCNRSSELIKNAYI